MYKRTEFKVLHGEGDDSSSSESEPEDKRAGAHASAECAMWHER
jgi:hypothetical protein